jgi:hypothetical protein
MAVDQPRSDYNDMLPKWQRLRDCSKGRDAIINAGAKYCPDLPGADVNGNKAYRARGNFFNATGRTVQGLNGAIFQDAPEVEIPETLSPMLDDITLSNVPFETFATECGKEVFLTGRRGILVDLPRIPTAADGVTPVTPGAPIDLRPYCIAYRAEDIINWRTERRGGDEVLTMVVLHEVVEVGYTADDPFTCKTVEQYRVVKLDEAGNCIVQCWQKSKDDKEYAVTVDGDVALMRRGEPLKFVPFIFMGALHTGPHLQQPPLIDLADVNLAHWRNSVDYEYGLHLVALPTPWVAGAKGSGDGSPMKIGPSVVWDLDVQGKAGMLEFSGTGLGSIVVAMEEKKKQMAALGARLLEDANAVAQTATEVRMRHTGETASIKTIAQSLEMGLTQVLQICVWWQGVDTTPADADANVELNKEYLDVRATPQEMQVNLTMLQAGEISYETFYNLLQTGGWAREGVTAEDEQKAIATGKKLPPEPAINPELSPAGGA